MTSPGTTNAFAGQCFRCGKRVGVEQGWLSFSTWEHSLRWGGRYKGCKGIPLVQHRECEEQHRGTFHHFSHKDQLA